MFRTYVNVNLIVIVGQIHWFANLLLFKLNLYDNLQITALSDNTSNSACHLTTKSELHNGKQSIFRYFTPHYEQLTSEFPDSLTCYCDSRARINSPTLHFWQGKPLPIRRPLFALPVLCDSWLSCKINSWLGLGLKSSATEQNTNLTTVTSSI